MAATLPISAQTILERAFTLIGVKAQGESLSAADAIEGLGFLNELVDSWRTQFNTSAFISREVFAVVANQNTYTIGPGGDFNTSKPLELTGAGWVQNVGTTNELETPTGLFTDDSYQNVRMKNLTNTLWTNVYYNPTYASGLGSIFLWPTPTSTTYELALYRRDNLAEFATLTQAYWLPNGYARAYVYNVACELATPWGRPLPPDVASKAGTALMAIKRQNEKLNDLPIDPAFTGDRHGGYNINTDQGG